MALPDRTLCWVQGPPWDRSCEPVDGEVGDLIASLQQELSEKKAEFNRMENAWRNEVDRIRRRNG